MDSCCTYSGMLSAGRARVICGHQEKEEYRCQFIYYIALEAEEEEEGTHLMDQGA